MTDTTDAQTRDEEEEAPTNVLIGFVLDRSGSMASLRDATIDGFNEFLTEQRQVDVGNALMSLTTFSTSFDVPFVGLDIHEVPNLGTDMNPYNVGGMTALYDAVGTMIEGISAWLANHPAWSGRPIVAIWTDGQENSSRQWSLDRVNALIEEKQKAGWEFVFMGTGSAAWTEGTNFVGTVGHHNTVSVADNYVAATSSYAAMGQSVNATRKYAAATNTADTYEDIYAQREQEQRAGVDSARDTLAAFDQDARDDEDG